GPHEHSGVRPENIGPRHGVAARLTRRNLGDSARAVRGETVRIQADLSVCKTTARVEIIPRSAAVDLLELALRVVSVGYGRAGAPLNGHTSHSIRSGTRVPIQLECWPLGTATTPHSSKIAIAP